MSACATTGELSAWMAFAGEALLGATAERLLALARELPAPGPAGPLPGDLVAAIEDDPAGLESEHVRLFLNPEGAPCPPWQSAHGEEPRLMGAAHLSALRWYRARGVEPRAAAEPADHAGLLLAFGSRLLESEPAAIPAFHREHLAWIAGFGDLVARHARHPFYILLADATRIMVMEANDAPGSHAG